MGVLAKAARTLEEEAEHMRMSSESMLRDVNSKMTSYFRKADSFVENADVNMKSALDRAELRARVKTAQTIGRTIVELEQIRKRIVEKES